MLEHIATASRSTKRRQPTTAGSGSAHCGGAEALRLAVGGAHSRDIAADLVLSVGTVRNRLSSAVGKPDARTLVDAVRTAKDQGWV
ncbi:hypothetical protein [Streptomyces sp. SR-10]|uniref:hypothetical protein n=1 Tax=Streptomyces sp. SR-10 TaxID=3416442 RepID=UPI003CE8E4E8